MSDRTRRVQPAAIRALSTTNQIEAFNVLGVPISALTLDRTVDHLAGWIAEQRRTYVSVCNVHAVMEARRSPDVLSAVSGATIATPDGMPLVWWGRAAAADEVGRVYGPDLLEATLTDPRHAKTRHYFYGGGPGIAERLAEAAHKLRPDVEIAGWSAPPFRALTEAEERATTTKINAARPDIVWVGLGCPKQELWMARNRVALDASALIGVGAAFDFLTGQKRQAPRWVQRSGLEWLFRLASEPRRLWRRYFVTNTLFCLHAFARATRLRRYPLPRTAR